MTQLIAHLAGDYLLQAHTMAQRKTSSWPWALTHALFYGIPFLFLVTAWWQWAVIVGTHAFIDRYAVARRWCRFYGVGFPGIWDAALRSWSIGRKGYDAEPAFVDPPPFLGVWLVIICDNCLHLAINAWALS